MMTFMGITGSPLTFGMNYYQAIMGLMGSVVLFGICSYYHPLEYENKVLRVVNLAGTLLFGIGMIILTIFKGDLF